jgi:tape measure domain-containing protein
MSTLEKLKQGLNLSGASKGLENVNAAAKGINLAPLGQSVETVGLKFNAMYSIADQALRNITTRVQYTAERMIKELTIAPITTGLQEYETQINAVQTILANTESKGTTLGQVNAALDELNRYADMTIYNFTEMTRNIGTFTAAGVDLNTSVNAIQGIANLAAVSGSSSQQASTAMYQLSQALASGTVKLMDWNSVVNAGMGGQVFQDALKETARVHGVAIDDMIKKNGSFRETLKDGWLTSEILTETLSHFTMAAEEGSAQWENYKKALMDDGYSEEQANAILKLSNTATNAATKVKTATQLWDTLKETAQSGWTQTWEIILGDFGEAKKLFSGIYETLSPILEATAEARNKLLEGGLSSGWKQLLGQGISDEEGYRESIKNVAKDHGVAIDDMIKAEKELDSSLDDNEAFQKVLQKGLKDGSINSDMLSESVTNLADKMRNMTEEEREAAGYTKEHLTQIEALEKGLKDGSISMDEFTEKMMKPSGRENLIDSLYNAFKALMSVITPIKEAFSEIFPALKPEQLYAFTETLRDFTAKLTLSETASNNLKRTFKGVFAILDILKQAFVAVVKAIAPLFGGLDNLGGGILGVTASWGDWLVALDESIKKSGFFNKIVEAVHKGFAKIKTFLEPVIEGFKNFKNVVSEVFGSISIKASERLEPLAAFGNFIKNVFVGLGKIVQKVFPYVSAAASGIANVVKDLLGTLATAIQEADYDKVFDVISGGILSAIGVGIAKFLNGGGDVFSGASGIVDGIKEVLEGAGDALGAFQQSMQADALKKIATAIAILAGALLVLALIPSERLATALLSVTTLFGELLAAIAILNKIGDLKGIIKTSGAIVALSSALLILSVALKIMSTMSWSEMGVGLISLTVGLGALVGAVNLLPEKKVKGAAKAIKKLSTAMLILAVAIKIMSTMSWEEMGIGLITMVVGLGAMVAAVNLLPKNTALRAAGLVGLATAMVILSAALKIMATMSWEEIARSLTALAGSLGILAAAMALMKKALPGAAAMMIVAPALVVLAGALHLMSDMSWEEIAKGLVALGGSLLIIAGAMALMKSALPGAAALMVVTASLAVLTPVLMALGSMSLGEIGKSLLMLAGVFAVFGLAALVLKPLVPTMLALSGSLTLLGIACAAIGAGVLMCGVGLTMLAAALAASGAAITTFIASIISLVPFLIEQIGIGLVKLLEVISGSGAAIYEAATVIMMAFVDAIVTAVPHLVEGALVLIDQLLTALVEFTPRIVTGLFDFLIGVINAIADKLPELIQAGVNLLMKFFSGVVDALKNIDPDVLINGLTAVGVLTAIVLAMAAVALLTPAAMLGVLGMGAVITELAIVLAAIGALAQIPGLDWLVAEGGNFLQTVGNAIGKFVGGLVGGFGEGVSSSLPQIGTDLSTFMNNAQGFIEGAKSIDAGAMDGVKSLVGVVMALTGADILQSLTSWLTGGSSLVSFGEELASFGPYMRTYADSVAGIDSSAVTASATAAQALAEMTSHIPNEGGVAAWFAGENSISKFGTELVTLGTGLAMYSMAITGFNSAAVIASANAATALADMTSHIPNEGGMVAWFTGENSVAKFGLDLVLLGNSLAAYSNAIVGFNGEAVIASANAAMALADMTSKIPNEGGMVAWFTGENSVAKFGFDLVLLGTSLSAYSTAISGFNAEAVIASANAAQALVDMTSHIPNEGGMVAWFTGENSVVNFGSDLVILGNCLSAYSNAIVGFDAEAVSASASAAQALAQMTSYIPNEGGMVAWFTGENSLSKFGTDLISLGTGLKGFSEEIAGVNAENITAAASAAQALAQMASYIPNEGGLKAWFTGDNSVASFAEDLPKLGEGLKGFSDSIDGIVPENVTAAANAAKSLAKLAEITPAENSNLSTFGYNLEIFGEHLKVYFEKISGITSESISASSNAIKAVKGAASGLESTNFTTAATAIEDLVDALKKMSKVKSDSADGFSAAVKKLASTNVKSIVDAFKTAGSDMTKAGEDTLKKFIDGAKSKESDMQKSGQTAIDKFIKGIESKESKAKSACKDIASACAKAMKDKYDSFKSAGKYLVDGFASGISAKTWHAEAKAKAMAKAAATAAENELDINSPSKVFRAIGYSVPEGFAMGIDRMSSMVTKSSVSMASAAVSNVKSSISRMADMINSDIDSQPTIRPVLDLSNVRSGASAISGMFGNGASVGVLANVNSISSMMNTRSQNGVNTDVVSAIDKLRKDLSNIGGTTYNVNGITYDDGSNIAEAVKSITRAAVRERRV